MNPIVASMVIGVMVTLSRWRKGEMISIDNVIGIAGVAVSLAVISQMNKDLARSFGTLAVVGTALYQVPDIVKATGLGDKA